METKTIVKNSWNILNEEELAKLAAVIGELEVKTSGEIRLVIVRSSSTIGHVYPMMFGILFLICLVMFGLGPFGLHLELQTLVPEDFLWPLLLLMAAVLSFGLSRFNFIRRVMTSNEDLTNQVNARAELEFHRAEMAKTKYRTGILVFLSLMEHRAVVLADSGISSKVPPSTWDNVVKLVLAGAFTGEWALKLEDALRMCGGHLAQFFPSEANNVNELLNHVIVKE